MLFCFDRLGYLRVDLLGSVPVVWDGTRAADGQVETSISHTPKKNVLFMKCACDGDLI